MTSPFRVPRPQTEQEKRADLDAWKILGCGVLKFITGHDSRRCHGVNKYGKSCDAWGCFQSPDGRRWCHAHRVHESERR